MKRKNIKFVLLQEITLVKAGGPLGLSIIGGSDHSCVPFGTGEPGIFISKVAKSFVLIFFQIQHERSGHQIMYYLTSENCIQS
jgi:hypothetical protein